jgi:hypothetical protein
MRFVHIFVIAMYPYNYNPVRDHCNGEVHDERRRFTLASASGWTESSVLPYVEHWEGIAGVTSTSIHYVYVIFSPSQFLSFCSFAYGFFSPLLQQGA